MLERLILPDLGDAKIVTLTPAKIRQWHAGPRSRTPDPQRPRYALLHAICATAVQDEVLDANPCRIRAAMQTKRKRDVDVLTPAEVDRLAAKMPARTARQRRAGRVVRAAMGRDIGTPPKRRHEDCAALRVRRAVTYRKGEFLVGEPKTAAGVRDVAVPPHIRPVFKSHLRTRGQARP